MNGTFLKFHLEDRKEDMKKKWKMLGYLDALEKEAFENKQIVLPEKGVKRYSISRLRKIFGAV